MTLTVPRGYPSVTFRHRSRKDFYSTLKERVDNYFKENKLACCGDKEMWGKTLVIFSLYLLLYAPIISGLFSFTATLLLYSAMGALFAIIGFNICHDALHGALCASRRSNRMIGYFFDFNGMSSYVWMISHNLHHHTFTNIPGIDQDIDKMIWLRLTPTDGRYPFHRFQHLYALPLYCLTTLNWNMYSDFSWFYTQWQEGKVAAKDGALFLLFKANFFTLFLFLPMALLPLPWWQTALCYLAMQLVCGFISAIVFQLAHLVEGLEYPVPDAEGKIEDEWVLHELKTTSNFAVESRWLPKLIGGLNYQIEHHLFPHVCHVHYPALSRITRATAREFNMPYHAQETMLSALRSHLRHLRRLGSDAS